MEIAIGLPISYVSAFPTLIYIMNRLKDIFTRAMVICFMIGSARMLINQMINGLNCLLFIRKTHYGTRA